MDEYQVAKKFYKCVEKNQSILQSGFNIQQLFLKLELNTEKHGKHYKNEAYLSVFRKNYNDLYFLENNISIFKNILENITGTEFEVYTSVYHEKALADKYVKNSDNKYNLSVLEVDGLFLTFLDKCKEMPYSEYLKTKHWRSFREKALKHKKYRCEKCKSIKELDVHHKNYDCLGRETFDDVKVLCIDCHSKEHGRDLRQTR